MEALRDNVSIGYQYIIVEEKHVYITFLKQAGCVFNTAWYYKQDIREVALGITIMMTVFYITLRDAGQRSEVLYLVVIEFKCYILYHTGKILKHVYTN